MHLQDRLQRPATPTGIKMDDLATNYSIMDFVLLDVFFYLIKLSTNQSVLV